MLAGPDEWYDAARHIRPGRSTSSPPLSSRSASPGCWQPARRHGASSRTTASATAVPTDDVPADRGRSWVIDPLPGRDRQPRSGPAWRPGCASAPSCCSWCSTTCTAPAGLLRDARASRPRSCSATPASSAAADGIGRTSGWSSGATDLARERRTGTGRVIADKTAAPSGAGLRDGQPADHQPGARRGAPRTPRWPGCAGFFHTMAAALRRRGPASTSRCPGSSLLSPGPGSETAFDQGFLATLLGFPLVEADDLSVRDGRVWIRGSCAPRAGRRGPAPRRRGLLRPARAALRLPARASPGLVEADPPRRRPAGQPARRGRAGERRPDRLPARASPSGCSARTCCCRRPPTWWCGDARPRSHVLANLDRLVRQADRPRAVWPARFGWELDRRRARRPAPRDRGQAVGLGGPGADHDVHGPGRHPGRPGPRPASCCAPSASPTPSSTT